MEENGLPSNFLPRFDVIGNGRKKLLIIGKTGTGKSSLCNVISGRKHNADLFPASASAESCTQHTVFADVFFNKDKACPISLIDTIGFDDPSKDTDAQIIAELVDRLKNDCDYVNLFVIAVNGQNPRLDGSLIGMIKIFEGMFSKQFWNQVVIVFTRMPMDKKNIRRRKETTGQTDDELAVKYMKVVQDQFKEPTDLKYLFLDACFDEEDTDEQEAFNTAMKSLYESLEDAPGLPTTKVQQVETEHATLKREIAEKEKEREEMEASFQSEVANLQQEMQQAQAESAAQIAALKAALNRKKKWWQKVVTLDF